MKKLFAVMAAALLSLGVATAQTRSISGKVSDSKGVPVPGATIKLKSGAAVAADGQGNFTISAKTGDVLTISSTDFETSTTKVDASSTVIVGLTSKDNKLSEVVVTAMGLKRNKNQLPYAAQQVRGDEVSRTRGGNAASALSGKISGLQVIQGNSIGGSTNVVIRGTKSLTGNNQALFIVDGVPIDNSNTNSSSQKSGAGGYDYGNAAADINPDDIESVTVLKGAAATALYGSRAANGVIMITSKKAKKGVGITINTGIVVGSIDKSTFPKYQTQYGAGYSDPYDKDGFLFFDVNKDGVNDLVTPTTEDASYGTKFDPKLMVYQWDAFDKAGPNYHVATPWVAAKNNPSTFYINPVSNNTNIQLDGATDKGMYKLGYTRNEEFGVLPNSRVAKNIVNFSSGYSITDKLTASGAINYSKVDGKGRYGTGYSGLNVNQNFRQWYQTNVDIKQQKAAYDRNQKNVTWNWADPSNEATGLLPIYTDNYYWMVNQQYETDTRNRIFGNASLNYKVNNSVNILARVSLDTYNEFQEERIAVGSNKVSSYSRYDRSFRETNYDLLANFDKDITADWNLKALAGVNMRRSSSNSIFAATNGGLIVPGLYSVANTKNAVLSPVESYQARAVDGYFAGTTLGYKEFLTLDATIRRDRSSTLPTASNAYNYYAVSGSWLFSKNLDLNWLSSGKLRANYATVGNDAPFASLKDVYDQPNAFGSTILYSLPSTKNNPALLPEKTRSKEIGLEMAFLRNRIGFDVSYYHTNTINQIIPVAISTGTGYSNKYVNAGNIENKGFEVSIFGAPIKTKDLSWDINLNFTRNRNKVLELYGQSTNLQIASFQGGVSVNATLGQPYGTIQGATWQYVNGQKLVKANGRYAKSTTTNNVIGNINPDWTGGIYNTFRYKAISLGFLIDVRSGGSLFSLDRFYGLATGVTVETTQLNDLGNPSRNTIATGGGVIMAGVTADGKPNTRRVENNYGTYGYAQNPTSEFIYDASYVKLREMVLSYQLPQSLIAKTKVVKSVEVSVIGRNLWIIHKNLPYSDPEENLSSGNAQGYQSGAYPTTRSIGVNLKFKF